jgi:hypothetical protein
MLSFRETVMLQSMKTMDEKGIEKPLHDIANYAQLAAETACKIFDHDDVGFYLDTPGQGTIAALDPNVQALQHRMCKRCGRRT